MWLWCVCLDGRTVVVAGLGELRQSDHRGGAAVEATGGAPGRPAALVGAVRAQDGEGFEHRVGGRRPQQLRSDAGRARLAMSLWHAVGIRLLLFQRVVKSSPAPRTQDFILGHKFNIHRSEDISPVFQHLPEPNRACPVGVW